MESRQPGNENGVGCTTSWQVGQGLTRKRLVMFAGKRWSWEVLRKTSPDFGARGKKGLRGHLCQGFNPLFTCVRSGKVVT